MSVRLVKSGRWNLPVGTHGWGAWPHTEDAEEVEDPLTDILSKSAMDPGSDPGGGGGKGSGGPPTIITGAAASATGFTTGAGVGMVMLATLAYTTGAMAWVTGGAGINGWRRQGIWRGWNPYWDRSHYGRWRKVYLWRVWHRVRNLT